MQSGVCGRGPATPAGGQTRRGGRGGPLALVRASPALRRRAGRRWRRPRRASTHQATHQARNRCCWRRARAALQAARLDVVRLRASSSAERPSLSRRAVAVDSPAVSLRRSPPSVRACGRWLGGVASASTKGLARRFSCRRQGARAAASRAWRASRVSRRAPRCCSRWLRRFASFRNACSALAVVA